MPEQPAPMSNREKAGQIADAIGEELESAARDESFGIAEATGYAQLIATLAVVDQFADLTAAVQSVAAEIARS